MKSPLVKIVKCAAIKMIVVLAVIAFTGQSFAVIDPDNPPASMRVTVDKSGQTRTFYLEKYNMRGDNFELVLLGTDGVTKTTIPAGPVRTYRGWCEEEPDSNVEATLLPNGDLRYHVFKGTTDGWWYNPPYEANEYAGAVNNFTEIGGTPNQPTGSAYPGASFGPPAATLSWLYKNVYQADIGFDLMVEYVNTFNYTDISIYGRKAENAMGHYNGIYIRDMLVEHKLGKVVIRQSRAGLDYSAPAPMEPVNWPAANTIWDSLFPDVSHNFIAFVGQIGGGVAFACDYGWGGGYAARSMNAWSADGNWLLVSRHENGHNWGPSDCVEGCPGPDGPSINSGNSIELSRFSNPEIDQAMTCRSSRYQSLDHIGEYSYPLPPYANLDEYEVYIGDGPIAFDLIGNDYDANGDQIALADFPDTTPLGGTLTFSAGTGPDGRDQLIYGHPLGQDGFDKFQYSNRRRNRASRDRQHHSYGEDIRQSNGRLLEAG